MTSDALTMTPEEQGVEFAHPWSPEESNLFQHALRELQIAGMLLDPEDEGDLYDEYNHQVSTAVLELIGTFARQDHSGFSASMVTDLFTRLSRFEALTPITNDPAEWFEHEGQGRDGESSIWQCKRQGSLFSEDGGKTYYDLNGEVNPDGSPKMITAPNKEVQNA